MKLKGVGESFKKYPDYESKGIKAHFNLDESGVLSLDRVSAEGETLCTGSRPSPASLLEHEKQKGFRDWVNVDFK